MNITASEIEGSQLKAARTAGNGSTFNNPNELRYNISVIRDIASQYCSMTVKDIKTRVFFVCYFTKLMKCVNNKLPSYIKDLQHGQSVDVFCISASKYKNDEFWTWCDKICSDMKGQKIYGSLKSNIDELKTQLADAENTLRHCNPELFEKFFFAEAKNYSYDGVKKKFDDWMYDNLFPDIETLRELQARVVAEALKKGILDFAPKPSYNKIGEVKVDYLKKLLPCDFEMTQGFIEACAQWREFIHWEGTILVINYKKYGKYIQSHYYDFNDVQLKEIFELDMMLHLIHKEMQNLKAGSEAQVYNIEAYDNEARKSRLVEIIEILKKGNWKAPATTENITQLLNAVLGSDVSLLEDDDEQLCEKMWAYVEGVRGDNMKVVPANLAGFFKEENLLNGSPKTISDDLFGKTNNQSNNINKGKSNNCSNAFAEVIPFLRKYTSKIIRQV